MLPPSITLLTVIAAAVIPSSCSRHDDVLHVFILAGQSNMAGRGGVINTFDPTTNVTVSSWDGVVPPECSPDPYGRILRLSANLTWVLAEEPLHADIDVNKTNGVGPGMAFANEVLRRDPARFRRIALVPCAIGGTRIAEWERGGSLYGQLVKRAKAAMGVDGDSGARMEGLLWYQGESDTVEATDAARYKVNVERFFRDLRADLGMPSLPIFQVAIASAQGPYMDAVRKAQFDVNTTNIQTVDAKGLPLEPDHVHLTTLAEVQLGKMLATAFLPSIPSPLPVAAGAAAVLNSLFFSFLTILSQCMSFHFL
ncbi:hypothetical protein MLD38_024728 [Melastoma candidum]|uniref:Uncharacterized protein n=1 Tax=Melastoma candidum TaxID=119954 RepID=A0ACB9NUI6_9MYRT|nr:hypothetical protein MLD38_024728 [Melastoma candidum]